MVRLNKAMGAVAVAAMALSLGACGTTAGGGSGADDEVVNLTLWSWDPVLPHAVKAWNKSHPNIQIKLVNAGSGNDEYVALGNAISAGSGAPDLVMLNADAMPQFAIQGALEELDQFGAKDVLDGLTMGAQSAAVFNDKMYIMPMGTGPMALFYNKELFDKAGVTEPPKTWDDYIVAAQKIHALGDDVYITNDSPDAGFINSLIWQAGGKPFKVDGEHVTINLKGDKNVNKVADMWQSLLADGLVDTTTKSWTDDWYRGMNSGRIASLLIGAWMPVNLKTNVPDGNGKWRVAEIPMWDPSDPVSTENGGGGLSIVKGTKHPKEAYEFAKYISVGEGAKVRVENGDFPNSTAELEEAPFLDKTDDYFGGQKINEVFAASAGHVKERYQYLPYQVYAGTIYPDKVGKGYSDPSAQTLQQGLDAWQDDLVTYGKEQGYTVN